MNGNENELVFKVDYKESLEIVKKFLEKETEIPQLFFQKKLRGPGGFELVVMSNLWNSIIFDLEYLESITGYVISMYDCISYKFFKEFLPKLIKIQEEYADTPEILIYHGALKSCLITLEKIAEFLDNNGYSKDLLYGIKSKLQFEKETIEVQNPELFT